MNNARVAQLCFDQSLRFECIIWLAGEHEQPSAQFKDFCRALNNGDLKKWARYLKLKKSELEEAIDEDDFAMVAERISGSEGFLVNVATPVPVAFTEFGHSSHGFGYYTTEWFYAESLHDDAFFEAVQAWRKGVHDKRRQELADK